VLVAGGDLFLTNEPPNPESEQAHPGTEESGQVRYSTARASLVDLARHSAAVLRSQAGEEITLLVDRSVFTGPVHREDWTPDQTGEYVAAITAMGINGGRESQAADARLAEDPVEVAAQCVLVA
jgi:hypothetical protein